MIIEKALFFGPIAIGALFGYRRGGAGDALAGSFMGALIGIVLMDRQSPNQ